MAKIDKNKKYLFVLDLDGTTLSDSKTGEMHPLTVEMILKAQEIGYVCIVTGRPWRSTEAIYKKLNLNTIIGNYNGAHIHNPTDYNFIPTMKYLNLNEMLYILGDKTLKKEISNVAIEGPGWVQIKYKDPILESVFGFDQLPKYKVGLDFKKLPLKPTGVVFDVKPTTDVYALKKYLEIQYGDLGEFSSWSKGVGLTPVFDITSVGVNKARVVSLLMRYYHIKWENTISFGDSFNDISMLNNTNIAVVMKNADPLIKKRATIISRYSNVEGGVGKYLEKFLKDPEGEIKKSKKIRENRRIGVQAEIA